MSRYAGIIFEDTAAAPGLCVSVYLQGCPHQCPGCHNPETWDEYGGHEFTWETFRRVIGSLNAHGIPHTLCILGGEPFTPYNAFLTGMLARSAKGVGASVYVWTGYDYEQIPKQYLENVDVVIDGKFEADRRDVTLPLRGSSNQRVIDVRKSEQEGKVVLL